MGAGAVPVALHRLGVQRRGDVEVLGGAVQQPAGDPQLVGDLERRQRADLELPLPDHHLGVEAAVGEPGLDAVVEVLLDDLAPEDLVRADAAVVAALRRGEAADREAVRAAVLHERVLLLDAEQRLVAGVLLRRLDEGGAGVRRVGLVVGAPHLAHHEDVVAAADRVGTVEHRLEHAVALVARGLVGARTVEAPEPAVRRRRAGSSSSSAAWRSARCRRSRCIQPCRPRVPSLVSCARPGTLVRGASTRPHPGGRALPIRCLIVNAV